MYLFCDVQQERPKSGTGLQWAQVDNDLYSGQVLCGLCCRNL